MTKEQATSLIETYKKAWITQDPELILSMFTPDATFNDPSESAAVGHEGIRQYWTSKVVEGQKDISFTLKNVWVDGNTVVAEWDASFVDTVRNLKISLSSVGIFTVAGDKFCASREYYKSTKTAL